MIANSASEPAALIDREMERAIAAQILFVVADPRRLLHRGDAGLQAWRSRPRSMLGVAQARRAIPLRAALAAGPAAAPRQPRNADRAAGDHRQHPRRGKPLQGLAHRHGADAEGVGKVWMVINWPGRDLAVEDQLAELAIRRNPAACVAAPATTESVGLATLRLSFTLSVLPVAPARRSRYLRAPSRLANYDQ